MSIQAINSRNQFKGTIKEIVPGPVVSEVDVETPAGIVTSVITSRSISDLQLRVGPSAGAGQIDGGVAREGVGARVIHMDITHYFHLPLVTPKGFPGCRCFAIPRGRC